MIWLALAAVLYFFFSDQLYPNTAEKLSTGSVVTLERDMSGHYRAEVFINGIKAPALVDTGATGVAISQRLANKLGIQNGSAIRAHTANGDTVAYRTRLESVKLGGVEARDVAAMITPSLQGDVLLGMSFLSRMDVRLNQGTMTIRALTD